MRRAECRATLRSIDQCFHKKESNGLGIFADEEEVLVEVLGIEDNNVPIENVQNTVYLAGQDVIGDDDFRIMDVWKQDVGE